MSDIPEAFMKAALTIAATSPTLASDIARALMAADEAATKRCARLARITAPKDADFSGVWGEYEHGCDDTQGAIHAAILKGEP